MCMQVVFVGLLDQCLSTADDETLRDLALPVPVWVAVGVSRRADHVPVVEQMSALLWPCGDWRCCAVGRSYEMW